MIRFVKYSLYAGAAVFVSYVMGAVAMIAMIGVWFVLSEHGEGLRQRQRRR